jgi:hypothetical protein
MDGKLTPVIGYPTPVEFAPQLTRVMLEAMFDSHGLAVPASSNSTACREKLYGSALCLNDSTDQSTQQKIKKLDEYASKAEGTVSSATASAIRGLSIAALNNEAIAKSIEVFSGVTARKLVEKALWSRYRQPECQDSSAPIAIKVVE